MKVEIGQLRRWTRPPHVGETFLIIESGFEIGETLEEDPMWTFVMDGHRMWEFEDVINVDSEVINAEG